MIADAEWGEMKGAEKREWLREEVEDAMKRIDNLVYGIDRMYARQRELMGCMHKAEVALGIAAPPDLSLQEEQCPAETAKHAPRSSS